MARVPHLYNNLTRKKEELVVAPGETLSFYSCGPTTYDYLHVGNARALVVGDLIHRSLEALGHKVKFVRNFTDIDDKILERFNSDTTGKWKDPLEFSHFFVNECQKDMDSLGMRPADHTPKVSDTMDEIREMIQKLIEVGSAYEVSGEVYYNVESFADYGKLSKKKLEDLQHGIRVEVDQRKRNPGDFVLWKPAKEHEGFSFASPWGKGRPGWHIECSAMALKHLGKSIHIHHGGVDLMFPHHENEIAQSEAANGCQFSQFWCHNEFVNFGHEKMSKSLGNVVTIRKFVETYSGPVLRYMLVSTHYRSKIEWGEEAIDRSIQELTRIHEFLENWEILSKNQIGSMVSEEITLEAQKAIEHILSALADDLNTPKSLAAFFGFIRFYNNLLGSKSKDMQVSGEARTSIDELIKLMENSLGCIFNPQELLPKLNDARKSVIASRPSTEAVLGTAEIEKLLEERHEARAQKNFKRSDEIRDYLKSQHIEIKDNPDGRATWRYHQ